MRSSMPIFWVGRLKVESGREGWGRGGGWAEREKERREKERREHFTTEDTEAEGGGFLGFPRGLCGLCGELVWENFTTEQHRGNKTARRKTDEVCWARTGR